MRFLFEEKGVKRFELTSEHMKMAGRRKTATIKMVPSFNDIVKLRSLKLKIERALYCEILMSSGLRRGELMQVRFCDLGIGDVPIDSTTGKKSKYCAGSISLNRNVHSIKNDRSRKTYFSPLALRLMKIFMTINSIRTFNTTIPIFPWSEAATENWMDDINDLMSFESCSIIKATEKSVSVKDMSKEDLESIPASAYRLLRRRERQRASMRGKGSTYQEFQHKNRRVSAHSFRHLFAAIQVYRDYRGGANDLNYVKQLMGHYSSEMSNTIRYVTRFDILESFKQWQRLMVGYPSDWNNIVVEPINLNRPGTRKRRASEQDD
jgi:integrase